MEHFWSPAFGFEALDNLACMYISNAYTEEGDVEGDYFTLESNSSLFYAHPSCTGSTVNAGSSPRSTVNAHSRKW
jgi:hypothetical protein